MRAVSLVRQLLLHIVCWKASLLLFGTPGRERAWMVDALLQIYLLRAHREGNFGEEMRRQFRVHYCFLERVRGDGGSLY